MAKLIPIKQIDVFQGGRNQVADSLTLSGETTGSNEIIALEVRSGSVVFGNITEFVIPKKLETDTFTDYTSSIMFHDGTGEVLSLDPTNTINETVISVVGYDEQGTLKVANTIDGGSF